MKDEIIKFRTDSTFKKKVLRKAKKYKITVSELIRRKLENNSDEHLFI